MSSKRRRNENKYDLVAKLVNVINIVTSSSNTVKARFPLFSFKSNKTHEYLLGSLNKYG